MALVASRQCGVFSRMQVQEAGGDDGLIRRRVQGERWERVTQAVYRIRGVPHSYHQRLWIAVLALGGEAIVSHQAAASLHGMTGFPFGRHVVVTVPHSGHWGLAGTAVHQISDLVEHDVEPHRGLRITTPVRTLVDLAATCGFARLEVAFEDARSAKRVTMPEVWQTVRRVSRRGKPGMAKLTALLAAHGDGYVPPQSELERMLFRALDLGNLPKPRRQFPFPGRNPVGQCVDAAYPDTRLILEADGRRWHTRIKDLARDHARDNEAARAGWQTLRFLYEELRDAPGEVAATVRDVRAQRLDLDS